MTANLFIETEMHHQEKKETPINMTETTTLTGNHLGIPKPNETNPNLLSPEILNQRRGIEGIFRCFFFFRTQCRVDNVTKFL